MLSFGKTWHFLNITQSSCPTDPLTKHSRHVLKVLVFRYVQTQKHQSLQTQGMHRNTMLHTCFCDMLTQFTLTVAISIFSVLSAVIHNCKKTFFVISDNTAYTTLIVFMKSHVFDAFLCFIDPLFIVFKW